MFSFLHFPSWLYVATSRWGLAVLRARDEPLFRALRGRAVRAEGPVVTDGQPVSNLLWAWAKVSLEPDAELFRVLAALGGLWGALIYNALILGRPNF